MTGAKRNLGPGESPVVKVKYTHMLPEDNKTWTQFLRSGEIVFETVWYDVHVGRQMSVPLGSPQYMINVVAGISRKRIDVIGMTDVALYIIEVKPHANMESVGQVVTYKRLFVKEFDFTHEIRTLIVSKTCDADILETAERLGVEVIPMEGVLL